MALLGRITSALLLAGVAGGVLIGIRLIPDIQRYLRIRSM
jgi:hypothetical protein